MSPAMIIDVNRIAIFPLAVIKSALWILPAGTEFFSLAFGLGSVIRTSNHNLKMKYVHSANFMMAGKESPSLRSNHPHPIRKIHALSDWIVPILKSNSNDIFL